MCKYYMKRMYKRMERKSMQAIIGERKKALIEESQKFANEIYEFLVKKAQESLDPEGEMDGISVFFDNDTVMILPNHNRNEEWEFYIEFEPSAVTRRVIMLMLEEIGYNVDMSRIPLKWETGFVGKYFLKKA